MVYDIAVSGLGPAGLSFLKSLGDLGLRVIGFDKFSFPRRKSCAGGLTPKAYRILKNLFPETDRVIRVSSRKFTLFNGFDRVEIESSSVLTYLTDRKELDNLLFESVSRVKNFDLHLNEAVVSVEREGELWKIKTDKGFYKTRVLICADGVNSRLARILKVNRDIGFTFEADIETTWDDSILVNFSDFSWGYYWIFPKGDFITAGLGEFKKKSRNLNLNLKERFLSLNKKHGVSGKVLFEQGFPIPCGKRKNDVYRDNVLFLGDAGGLVDPLTGEGIYYAVKSGVMASSLVLKAFETGNFHVLKLYKELIDKIFGTEFFWARIVGNIFFNAKGLNFYVIRKAPELATLTVSLLTGEVSYKKALGEFLKLLPKLVVRV
jgi:geranylgeranyl reductase family protein